MTSETYLSNQKNIGKLVLHKVVRPIGAEILPFQFPVAAILDFLHNGHQGSPPTCVRWFLKTLYPYLTPCKVLKNCHKSARFLQILTYPARYRENDVVWRVNSCCPKEPRIKWGPKARIPRERDKFGGLQCGHS